MADEPTGPVPTEDNASKEEVKSEATEASKEEGTPATPDPTAVPPKVEVVVPPKVEAPPAAPEKVEEPPKPAAEEKKVEEPPKEESESDSDSEPLSDDDGDDVETATVEVKTLSAQGLSKLGYQLGEEAIVALKGLVTGAEEDLKKFGKEIGKNLILAVKADDEEWKKELLMQVRQLASIHRLGLKETLWQQAEAAIAKVIGLARVALASKGISIKL